MKEKLTLEWIGTGSGLNPVLGNTSFCLRGYGKTLLVDCGSTVPLELMKSGKIGDITDVVVTHAHMDHIGGLEGLGFMNYFALKKRGDLRTNLYVGSDKFAHDLWEYSLKGGMMNCADDNGDSMVANLETYYNVHSGKNISVPGFPEITFFETPHVKNLENYGVKIGKEVFYSGDSTDLPSCDCRIIFQDCQFYEGKGDVHISYNRLNRELSSEVKSKTHLVHLGGGWDKMNPRLDGFAGFVKPGDVFEI